MDDGLKMYSEIFLEKVGQVNEIYLDQKAKGLSNEEIYRRFIKHRFFISRNTFYNYLTIPYKQFCQLKATK